MRRGWTLVESLILLAVAGFAAVVYLLPSWLKARRQEIYYNACGAIRQIRTAEEALYTFDLDGNGRQDYWCRDIRGLARFRTKSGPLIDERLAAADGAYPDAQLWYEHQLMMLEVDEQGRPFADSSGFGPRYDYCLYPARDDDFYLTAYYRDGDQWGFRGRKPLRRAPSHPGAEGGFRFQ